MPTSMHVILIHGYLIVKVQPLSIGKMSEEALEANYKIFNRLKELFSRKFSQ